MKKIIFLVLTLVLIFLVGIIIINIDKKKPNQPILNQTGMDQYLGVYSSPEYTLEITISKKGNVLIAQGTGQPSFPLEAFAPHKFKYDPANVKIEFKPQENMLILRQHGLEIEFKKKQ